MMFQRQQFRWRQVPWERVLITSIILILVVIFVLIALLKSAWLTPMALIITGLSVLLASFQWLFPVSSITSQNDSNVPHGIVGRRPPIDLRAIRRGNAIRKVYRMFSEPEIGLIVMRGLKGCGKLTLAAEIYDYAEDLRLRGRGLFAKETLWIDIDATTPFSHLARDLFLTFDKPLPVVDFNVLTPQFQAEEVIKLLKIPESRLIIFNFNNPLDPNTGLTLAEQPGFAELLRMLESEAFPSVVLLTDCPWSQDKCTKAPGLNCIEGYDMKGLTETELMGLLENYEVNATDEEIHSVIRRSGGHVGALKLLIDILEGQTISLKEFLKEQDFAQIWMRKVENEYFRHISLSTEEVDVLSALSVYRKPVPLPAVQYILPPHILRVDILIAIPKLREKYLLRDVNVKDHYQVHALVAEYIRNKLQANQASLKTIHNKAAQYYLDKVSTQVLAGQRRTDEELELIEEAAWHMYQSGRTQEADELVQREKLYRHLLDQSP